MLARHPCYSTRAHTRYGRIHVPVAPRCNIQCNYCLRRFDCPNENRPGVTTHVLTPDRAMDTIRRAVATDRRMAVLGVAGPGDALANDATFEIFERARADFPRLTRCLATNGLLLPDRIDDLVRVGITALTITINAVDPMVGTRIYSRVRYHGTTYRGEEAFSVLARNQLEGLRQAARRGIAVKVNTVLIPGVNDDHLPELARRVKSLGAHLLNIVPLIPLGAFAAVPAPTAVQVARARASCAAIIDQFDSCQRCRADAIGVPGDPVTNGCALERAGVPR